MLTLFFLLPGNTNTKGNFRTRRAALSPLPLYWHDRIAPPFLLVSPSFSLYQADLRAVWLPGCRGAGVPCPTTGLHCRGRRKRTCGLWAVPHLLLSKLEGGLGFGDSGGRTAGCVGWEGLAGMEWAGRLQWALSLRFCGRREGIDRRDRGKESWERVACVLQWGS